MIQIGDVVEAVVEGGRDRRGLPIQIPMVGRIYRIKSIYEMAYGLGCTLHGMDPSPFQGYLLFVIDGYKRRGFRPQAGWYFRKAEADKEFTKWLTSIRTNKSEAR
jgi:hypothetical protein